MANGFDNTDLNPFLRHTYVPDVVEFLATSDHAAFAMIAKDREFGAGEGSNGTKQLTIGTALPQGGTADFDQAQTNAATSYARAARLSLSVVRLYQIAQVDGLTWDALKGKPSAQLDVAKDAADMVLKALGAKASKQLFRAGWGKIGTTATASGAGVVMTLTNPEDAINFEIGMVIVASSSENAATLRVGSLTVDGVDFVAGTVTMTAALSSITGLAANDSLFIKGDREDSATPTRLCVAGVQDWCPDSAPGVSDSFFGYNRYGKQRTFGATIDVSGYGTRDGIIYAIQKLHGTGARPTHLFMNPKNYGRLMMELATGGTFSNIEVTAGKGGALVFPAVKLFTNYGTLIIVEDSDVPVDRSPALKLASWRIGSVGGIPKLLDHSLGEGMFAVYNKDRIEMRFGGYWQVYCTEPGNNGVLKFA